MERQIDAYDRGRISIHDLNENASTEQNRELIGYYLLHTNNVSLKTKLAVARSYMFFGMYPDAVRLTAEYLNVNSNDFHAWNVLGASYLSLRSFDKASAAYTNAARLGDKTAYIAAGTAALVAGRWKIVESVIPQLIELRKSKNLSQDNKHDLAAVLLAYSIQFEKEDIFVETFRDITMKLIRSHADLTQLVTIGCKLFKGEEIDRIHQELLVS